MAISKEFTREESRLRIRELLESFVATSALVSASAPGGGISFAGRIARISSESLDICVAERRQDEFGADTINEILNVTVHLQDGASALFHTVALGRVLEGGGIFHRVKFPDVLAYEQRRQHRRVTAEAKPPPAVEITAPGGRKISAEVENLSITGVSFRVSDKTARIRRGDVFTGVTINFGDFGLTTCAMNIAHVQEQEKTIHVGARIDRIPPRGMGSVRRYMAAAEREIIREIRDRAGVRG